VAAPIYLRARSELTRKNIAVCVAALACLLVPTVGSFYPVPPVPVRYFPYYFLTYMLVGLAWLITVSRRKPRILAEIEAELEATVDSRIDTPVPATAVDAPAGAALPHAAPS
jgi:hypothetical protein